MPNQTHGVEHHIHTGSRLQSCAWIQKNLEIAKAELNVWNPPALFAIQNHHGPLLMVPKKDGSWRPCGNCAISKPRTSTPCQTCKTFLFSKIDIVKGYAKSLLLPQTSQKRRLSHHLACLSICSCHLDSLTLHRLFNE
jgi:hypothetical protein